MNRSVRYAITLQGVVDKDWAAWFDGISITTAQDAEGNTATVLACDVKDQPALHAILSKIRDLNLTLVSLAQIKGGHHG